MRSLKLFFFVLFYLSKTGLTVLTEYVQGIGVKIILSLHIRNFVAPNRLLNICLKIFYFNPKVALRSRLYGVKIRKIRAIEYLTLGHL
jgi:hypothetical protein